MSGTTKRTVSAKKIEPELVESPETPEPVSEMPKLKIMAVEGYQNYAIREGINWRAGSVHEVDFSTYQRLMMDNPKAFERV